VSFAWLTRVRSLAADAQDCLQDLHYRMMQAVLGVGSHEKVRMRSNVSGNSSRATSSSFFQSASLVELTVISIGDKLEGLQHGRPELSVAAPRNSSKLISVKHLVVRCILLCRGILGIMSAAGADEVKATREIPVFASDDLTYAGRAKDSMMDSPNMPTNVTDPTYLLPTFIRSMLFGSLKLQQPCTGASFPMHPSSSGCFEPLPVLFSSHITCITRNAAELADSSSFKLPETTESSSVALRPLQAQIVGSVGLF